MTKRTRPGRPRVPESEKGRVYTFFAPKELSDALENVLEYTGGTISEFLREAVSEKTMRALTDHKGAILKKSALTEYTGGSIDPQTGN